LIFYQDNLSGSFGWSIKLYNSYEMLNGAKMVGDVLEQLKILDQTVLTEVVRKDQQDADLMILDWTVEPIRHEILTDSIRSYPAVRHCC
jgi:hypothetical protein